MQQKDLKGIIKSVLFNNDIYTQIEDFEELAEGYVEETQSECTEILWTTFKAEFCESLDNPVASSRSCWVCLEKDIADTLAESCIGPRSVAVNAMLRAFLTIVLPIMVYYRKENESMFNNFDED